ncbi:MAG: hypothetical protein ACREUY_01480 [Burkholderiales bacterium]
MKLKIETVVERIPCGESITTIYRNEAGEIVRQDVEIRVSGEAMKANAGKVE